MTQPIASRIIAANTALFSDRNPDAVREFFAPDYAVHVTGQDLAVGHEGIRQAIGLVLRSFPALQCEVEMLVEGKDRIAWQRTLRGVQAAAFKGFPSRGREIIWRDMVTSRFRDGLIAEEWVVTDLAERLLLAQKNV